MDRRKFLRNAALGSAGVVSGTALSTILSSCRGPAGSGERPNIVVILSDDMGFSDIGSYGAQIDTPNIDRLARNGLRFSQHYNCARCSPTRASLLTGLYPHKAGMGHLATTDVEKYPAYRGNLNNRCVTIAEALKQQNYRTFAAGKWHVGTEKSAWPLNRGFDRFYGEHTYVDSYFYPTNQLYLNGEKVSEKGKDWYSTDAYTDHALDFIDETDPDGDPFFLYMAYNAAHFPLQAFQEDIAKYRGSYMMGWDRLRQMRYHRLIREGLIDPKWELTPRDASAPAWVNAENKERWDLKMAAYAAIIDRMDQNIGRIISKLEQRGELDNTLIVYLHDNGASAETWINDQNPKGVKPGDRRSMIAYGLPWANASNTPFRLFKIWVHEGGIATPLIVHWPNRIQNAGRISNEVSHVMDIMPTCLDAAGADYPDTFNGNSIHPMQGKSLMPIINGNKREGHDALGWEHQNNRAFRKGKYKIARAFPNINKPDKPGLWHEGFDSHDWELYNIEEDRTEMHNLADKKPDILNEMIASYKTWAEENGVKPWPQVMDARG